ncbi:hypothetical protein IFR05_014926 [Cadophora sp. M221]|nr:hypothetical protein IFR05_014926 [Cadophora sp. M221]
MALDMLSIPAMSTDPERAFSAAKINLSDRRNKMGIYMLEYVECLKSVPEAIEDAVELFNQSSYLSPREQESQYPPPPDEEDDGARDLYHERGHPSGGGVTLPSISPYGHYGLPLPNGYPADSRGYQHDPYQAPIRQYTDDRQRGYDRGGAQNMAFTSSGYRQRTAIACRYCRRRKIRCSGFDQNPEGRCSNCQRSQQECIFTPASLPTQSFVPAHAMFPGIQNTGVGPDGRSHSVMYPQGTQFFGAYGQPLGPISPPQSSSSECPTHTFTGSYDSFPADHDRLPPHQHPNGPQYEGLYTCTESTAHCQALMTLLELPLPYIWPPATTRVRPSLNATINSHTSKPRWKRQKRPNELEKYYTAATKYQLYRILRDSEIRL